MSLSTSVGNTRPLTRQYSAVRVLVESSMTRASETTLIPSVCVLSQSFSFGMAALQCGQSTDQKMSTLTLPGANIEEYDLLVPPEISGPVKSTYFCPTNSKTG